MKSLQSSTALDDVESSADGDGGEQDDADADGAEAGAGADGAADSDAEEHLTLEAFFAARFRNNKADEMLGSVAGEDEEPSEPAESEPMAVAVEEQPELSDDPDSEEAPEEASVQTKQRGRGRPPLNKGAAPQTSHELQTRAACDAVLFGSVLKMCVLHPCPFFLFCYVWSEEPYFVCACLCACFRVCPTALITLRARSSTVVLSSALSSRVLSCTQSSCATMMELGFMA